MKNFLGINWKIRMTHSVGIIQLIASAILPVLVYLGIDWQALTSWHAVGHAIMQVISNNRNRHNLSKYVFLSH